MPTTKRRCSTKVAKLSTVREDTQYNADIMFADDDEAVTCAQWDATAHWNTSDWKRFARSLVNRGFVDRYDFSLSVREVCEAKDEENEQAEKALMIAEEKLATESSPGLTAHEMSLSSEALCLRARQEVVGQTGTANQLLDAAINACCAFSDRHCAKDLTRAREALLESVKPIIGAAKAQRILDDIIKNFPPLLKGLHSQPEKKLTQLMALSAQLRDVVVWNICAEMKDPKDRDFFLMMMGQAFLPHDAANDTILRAQILLAYHRIEIYKFHGFKSNNWLVTHDVNILAQDAEKIGQMLMARVLPGMKVSSLSHGPSVHSLLLPHHLHHLCMSTCRWRGAIQLQTSAHNSSTQILIPVPHRSGQNMYFLLRPSETRAARRARAKARGMDDIRWYAPG